MIDNRHPTHIGRVRHVLGATVTVALDPDLAGVAPIFRGRLQPIGQIGSLVRIPQGLVDLIASVSLVGIAELAGQVAPTDSTYRDERWLQVELIGEIDLAAGVFRRGVGTYPGLDDPVHFAVPEQLASLFPAPDEKRIRVGCLTASEEVPVCLKASKLVTRHAAIVGSTGSGKTSAVASILQNLVNGGWDSANVVVVDPHGEYSAALEEHAAVRSVLATADNSRLQVPYWALPAEDISAIFAGTLGGATFANRFSELVTNARREFVTSAEWLPLEPSSVTADTPVPFDLRNVWYTLDRENRETRQTKDDPSTACEIDPGDPASLTPAKFKPYGPSGTPPHKGPFHGVYGTMPDLLRLGLLDPQLRFLLTPLGKATGPDPLIEVVLEWLGDSSPVSVLDFSGVPSRAADAAIGVVLNLLLELAVRGDPAGNGIGRPNPVLIVLEEAHRYLGKEASPLARASVNRIAREGRKYGVGLVLVTQRPTELPATALAQCGTLIALRLTNSSDQGVIRTALPDTIEGFASILPSLRTHEAILSGEALTLPVRAMLDPPNPWPRAADPSLAPWRAAGGLPDIASTLISWRETFK